MVSVVGMGKTETTLKLRVEDLPYAANTYTNIVIACNNGDEFGGLNYGGNTYTGTVTFTGLSPGTTYYFHMRWSRAGNSGSTSSSPVAYTTLPATQYPPSSPRVYTQSGSGGRYALFGIDTFSDTSQLEYTGDWGYSSGIIGASSNSYYEKSFNFSDWNRTYTFGARAGNGGGWSSYSYASYRTPSPPSPDQPYVSYSVNGKTISFTVRTYNNTSKVQLNRGWSTTLESSMGSNSTATFTYDVPKFSTSYSFGVRAGNDYGEWSSWYTVTFTSGKDNIPPVITNEGTDGHNGITVNFNYVDVDSGMKPSGAIQVYIGTAGGGTASLKLIAVLNAGTYTYTFTKDADGNLVKNQTTYPIRVRAYDAENNTSYFDANVTVIRTRPANMAWTYAKVKGGDFNLTANEWNYLLNRINEFREYRGYSHITTFIPAVSGETFTAIMFNQAVNIINTLTPPIVAPQPREAGDDITADAINRLRDSLNSIQ